MQGVMNGRERSLLEMAALAYGAAISLALILLLGNDRGRVWHGLALFRCTDRGERDRGRHAAPSDRLDGNRGLSGSRHHQHFQHRPVRPPDRHLSLHLVAALSRRVGRQGFTLNDLFRLTAGLDVVVLPLFVN